MEWNTKKSIRLKPKKEEREEEQKSDETNRK